jgi:hypothetical protein
VQPQQTSYLTSKCNGRSHPHKGGKGVFAEKPIAAGSVVGVWSGVIVDTMKLYNLSARERQLSVQVEEGLYLVSALPGEGPDFINHSCDPNVGLNGQIVLVAMRDIEPGEEICIDYAMCDGSPYDEFDCGCGSALCRGRITGEDWHRPELIERYRGYFSPYLQRRIAQLQAIPAQRITKPIAVPQF